MTRRPSKAINERNHAKRRLLERYGIRCNQQMYRDIIAAIRGQPSPYTARVFYTQSRTRVFHAVTIDEIEVVLIYDPSRGEIRTALKNEWVEDNHEAA